ncbi:hypothetical protein [Mycetocola saprophilus]|uniref:hypothetical protein n=1 Tax=Mycetocola saprophilus TaxID=76636 RepID=UPI0012DC0823|nr:hypothetical protein [Mycetocola saprophilus]
MIPQPTPQEQAALVRSLAPQRLRRFRAATRGEREAIELYVLDCHIASHLHAAVRIAEVALREAIHRGMSDAFGSHWYIALNDQLDAHTARAFQDAVRNAGPSAASGKIVSQIMLGVWVSLLGTGTRKQDGTRAHYVRDVWEPGLKNSLQVPRRHVARLTQRVNWARNRISHCEPVVFGLPMPGLGGPSTQVRRSPALIFDDVKDLMSAISSRLEPWFDRWDETAALLSHPLLEKALDHIESNAAIQLDR